MEPQHAALAVFLVMLIIFSVCLGLLIGLRREGPPFGAPVSPEQKIWYVNLNKRHGPSVRIGMFVAGALAAVAGIVALVS